MAGHSFRASFASLLTLGAAAAGMLGCQPEPPAALPTLPPPRVAVTQLPTPSPFPSPTVSPSPVPTIYPADYTDLYALARQAYGEEQLIQWISIPAINVESLVVPVGWQLRRSVKGEEQMEWDSPGPFVGWALNSALPDSSGVILLYGHNNLYGSVFRDLYRLQTGDEIILRTAAAQWRYRVTQVRLLSTDLGVNLLKNQGGAQLLLLSCYPPNSNTYRVLVSAQAAPSE